MPALNRCSPLHHQTYMSNPYTSHPEMQPCSYDSVYTPTSLRMKVYPGEILQHLMMKIKNPVVLHVTCIS